jgi:hypothetical protein
LALNEELRMEEKTTDFADFTDYFTTGRRLNYGLVG